MRMKFLAIGLALVLPLMAFSQTATSTTQKPAAQQPPKPGTQQVKPTPTPATQQQTKPATQQLPKPTSQQVKPASATQPTVRQVDGEDAMDAKRELFRLEPAERGGGRPYREMLNEIGRTSARYFSEQELEQRFLSTILWEVTNEQNQEDADAEAVAITAADATVTKTGIDRKPNNFRVLDVYVVTRDYIALYKRNEQSLEMIAKEGNDARKRILGKGGEFAERAPVILIYVASNAKLARIPLAKRDFYAAMDCGMAVQSANLFCASENLVTTTIEIDPIAVGKILGLKADKVLLAQPIGFK